MKNTYAKPEMQVEEFLANQYCSNCGKRPDGTYIFKCDAPGGGTYYYYKEESYYDYSSRQWKTRQAKYSKSGYHPCGDTHTTTSTSGYYEGFIDRNGNRTEDEGEHVLCWIDKSGSGHATVSLSMGEVEVVNS